MPDTQISEPLTQVERLRLAIALTESYDDRVFEIEPECVEALLKEYDELRDKYNKITAALSGHVVVPQSALDWLFGEGPDADGKWFGETIGDGIPKLAGRYPRTYWWRSKFRAMIQAAPPVPEMEPRP